MKDCGVEFVIPSSYMWASPRRRAKVISQALIQYPELCDFTDKGEHHEVLELVVAFKPRCEGF
jgi:hypothetical protein